ncbi:hypothetical protein PsYK624_170920 [Phanerochaete sordida]|uniref:Uncharacterized protein n=1 Tax=Phanerochaete sordida TaxID=48140 RepID=A0A9P3GRZ6_9APHY|nr:hypothetical protein PsYK624_170920 [Phanerochaete sordida]
MHELHIHISRVGTTKFHHEYRLLNIASLVFTKDDREDVQPHVYHASCSCPDLGEAELYDALDQFYAAFMTIANADVYRLSINVKTKATYALLIAGILKVHVFAELPEAALHRVDVFPPLPHMPIFSVSAIVSAAHNVCEDAELTASQRLERILHRLWGEDTELADMIREDTKRGLVRELQDALRDAVSMEAADITGAIVKF